VRKLVWLLLFVGCDDLLDTDVPGWTPDTGDTSDTDTGDTADTADTGSTGCPAGWDVPRSGTVVVPISLVDAQQLAFELMDEPYDGKAPACVSADGHSVRVLLGLGGQPSAWFTSSSASGAVNTTLATAEGVELDGFGLEQPTTWAAGDWYQGTWIVRREGTQWVHTVSGDALKDGRTVSIQIEVEVTP